MMSGKDAAAVACVPDMISSILERVPDPVSLFRCSLFCKDWRGLVSDPAFLRRSSIWPQQGGRSQSSASFLGIFVQRDRPRKISKLFPTTAPPLVPAPGSVLGPQLRFLTSFVRDDDGILDDAVPLAARDGLLLVRVWRPLSTEKNSGGGGGVLNLRLCLCNLLTGSLDLLPALELVADDEAAFEYKARVLGYALFTAADHCADGPHDARARAIADGYSTLFQVLLLVGRGYPETLLLHRFSSASGDWDALDCSHQNLRVRKTDRLSGPEGCRVAVAAVARGTAHWLFYRYLLPMRYCTLDVSASTGQVCLTALPVDAVDAMNRRTTGGKTRWLSTSTEGRLALLCVESNNRLVTMKQRGDGDHWDSGHVAEVHVDVELGFGRESLSPVCFGDRTGIALARSRSDPERRAYVLDLESSAGSATKVEGWIRTFNYDTAAPFEINWPTFFVSRLGVKL